MFEIFKGIMSKGGQSPEFDLDNYKPIPVAYQLRCSILERIRRGEDVLPEIDGREEAKNDVIRAILSGAHPYLVSEEGTGKTRLARSLTKLLPSIPVIKGCPYNDDPKWPSEWLCPRCREANDPVKGYGIEFISGERLFSRIQGNEYTNEAKLLGLKDIQVIAQGKSPSDPRVFTGTGIFRANRGILFVDELPAIRTKVQVLLHPILEERKAILEEYNWERPVDLLLIATGNPKGFAHVNEVPRPLLDRLELIYMDLPDEKVEKEIMFKERFKVDVDGYYRQGAWLQPGSISQTPFQHLERTVAAPWWVVDVVNKTVRYSRECRNLEKKASIRGVNKAIDHTYATVEMRSGSVANLRDACQGLKLALRGRVGLRPEFIDFEDPRKSFERTDAVVEDMMREVMKRMATEIYRGVYRELNRDKEKLANEISSLLSSGTGNLTEKLSQYPELKRVVDWMKRVAPERVDGELLGDKEKGLYCNPDGVKKVVLEGYNYSALEMAVNVAVYRGIVDESTVKGEFFVPEEFKR